MSAAETKIAPLMATARNLSTSIHEGVDNTRRALKIAQKNVADCYEDALHQVKRHAVTSLTITFGVAFLIGMGTGILVGRALAPKKSWLQFFR